MAAPGVLITKKDIIEALSSIASQRGAIQSFFNQGKYVYQTSIVEAVEGGVYLDFDGIEETTLMSIIDFYSPTVFVFFDHGLRYQFLAKNSSLVFHAGRSCLLIHLPNSITVVPGRKTARYEMPRDAARFLAAIDGSDYSFAVREMSQGGLSMWSTSSHGLTPHSTIKNSVIEFTDGARVPCSVEIVRINYTLDDPAGQTHIISCEITAISPKDAGVLTKRLENLTLAD